MLQPRPPIRFGTSGWRAVIAEEFTFANARRVITAIARVLSEDGRGGDLVLVGYDTRFLAERFAEEAARLFAREGFRAEVSSRPVPTPTVSFDPVPEYLADLGKKVSASDVARGNPHFSLDFRFGTSAGFLDAFLESAGARLSRLNAKRDPLFGGESPQCGE